MTKEEFKIGQKYWHLTRGVVKVIKMDESEEYLVLVQGKALDLWITVDGKEGIYDSYPIVISFQEARDRGFPDVPPDEPLGWEERVEWLQDEDGLIYPSPFGDCGSCCALLGKIGTLTFVEDKKDE